MKFTVTHYEIVEHVYTVEAKDRIAAIDKTLKMIDNNNMGKVESQGLFAGPEPEVEEA